MPLAQSIQYIWVTCASIVAILATYQLATHSLSILSDEGALHGFDSIQWLIKLGPAASSGPATSGENDLQNATAVAVPTLKTLSLNATFGEKDLRNGTEVVLTIPMISNLNTTNGGSDCQNGTVVAIPASTTLDPGATNIAAESRTSDAVTGSQYNLSADEGPGQAFQEDSNALWNWINNVKKAVNRTFFHFLSIVCFLLPPICVQLRNSWFDLELYGRIEKTLRPSIPTWKMNELSMGVIVDLEESAIEGCQTDQAGLDMSTLFDHLHARDRVTRHVQRKQTARAEKMRRRAVEAKKILKRDYLKIGKAVMTRLHELEAEVATVRKTGIDYATPALSPATPTISPAQQRPTSSHPPDLQFHPSSGTYGDVGCIERGDFSRRGSVPSGAKPDISVLKQGLIQQHEPKAAPIQDQCPTPYSKDEGTTFPKPHSIPQLPQLGQKESSIVVNSRPQEAPRKAEIPAFLAQTLKRLGQKNEPSADPVQNPPPSRLRTIPCPSQDDLAGQSKPVFRQPVAPPRRQASSNTYAQHPKAGPKRVSTRRQGKPEIPAFLLKKVAQETKPNAGSKPTTPSRLEGMVYDTNVPVKKTLCEADKMCSSRVCGKAHHGPKVNPSRPFTIDDCCIYDQNCTSRNCTRWHNSPASADRQSGR